MQQEEKAEQELPVDKVVEGIGIEMEEGYEHVEQLASGETVQPEDEEQEKTGPLTPEGTSTGGENVGNEEEGEFEETQKADAGHVYFGVILFRKRILSRKIWLHSRFL